MPLNRSEGLTGGFMRLKPTYNWTFSKEPVDALVNKQEREARKGIVVRGKTGKRYRVEKSPRPSGRSVMSSVQEQQHVGSSKRTKEEASVLLSMAMNKLAGV
jgi:hypothetical protein